MARSNPYNKWAGSNGLKSSIAITISIYNKLHECLKKIKINYTMLKFSIAITNFF
uniref:Uncharacterized protein n=1 Tax=Aegilops tauschii subsp. strangulata TaxID=200361 RepID=A0A453MA95_AEGTS